MFLLGIVGPRGSGKNTLASFLKSLLPTSTIFDLGEKVMEEVSAQYGMTLEFLKENKRKDESIRKLLQYYAEEKKKLFGEDYWIEKVDLEKELILIPSIRFRSEASYIRKHSDKKGFLVELQGRKENVEDKHISETELYTIPGIDYRIDNSKHMNYLKFEAKNLAIYIKERIETP